MTSNAYNTDDRYTGTIPTEIGLLLETTAIQLYPPYSSFSGTIPSELGAMSQMSGPFDLSKNHLTGTLPSQLGPAFADMFSSGGIRLNWNSLTGSVMMLRAA